MSRAAIWFNMVVNVLGALFHGAALVGGFGSGWTPACLAIHALLLCVWIVLLRLESAE